MAVEVEDDPSKIAHFSAVPWCAKYINDPAYTPVSYIKDFTGSPTMRIFMEKTLQTDQTIRATLALLHGSPSQLPTEVVTFLDLGGGVTGFRDVCHGGFVATVLDDVTGMLIYLRRQYAEVPRRSMTIYLNVSFKRPVAAPSIVAIKAWVKRVEGRKVWLEAALEDQDGNVCASCEALFLELRSAL